MKHKLSALLLCLSLLLSLCACSSQEAGPAPVAEPEPAVSEVTSNAAPVERTESASLPAEEQAPEALDQGEPPQPAPTGSTSGSKGSSTGGSSGSSRSKKLTFPHQVGNSDLYIDAVLSYDGMFVEDGTDRNVTSIATIRLSNRGTTPVEYARLTLEQGSRRLEFVATCLLPGATMLVLESSAQKVGTADYTSCELALGENASLEQDSRLLVEETEEGVLQVTNLTDDLIPSARIYYKIYMQDEDVYVGGITYTVNLEDLAPGEPLTVMPTHYSSGNSKIIMSRVYS